MRRLVILLMVTLLAATTVRAGDDREVVVTRQLTAAQRGALPDKTLTLETRSLVPAKRANAALLEAINQVLDTVAGEDYLNRTFVVLIEPKGGGEVSIAAHSDDILAHKAQAQEIIYGDIKRGRCHFALLIGKDNRSLLETLYKRQGKIKFVQEFEIVEFKTPYYPTNVIARWNPAAGLSWLTVSINENR